MAGISVHLHSTSMRYHLRHAEEAGGFDAHTLIDEAKNHGFSGVTLSADGPNFHHLGGMSGGHLRSIGSHVAANAVSCQVETSDTEFEHMKRMLAVAAMLQADTLRVTTIHSGTEDEVINATTTDLAAVAPYAADAGVTVLVENDQHIRAEAVARIVAGVNDVGVKAVFDVGTPQIFGADPRDALAAVAPWAAAAHIKDQVVIEAEGGVWIQGTVIGAGHLPLADLLTTMAGHDIGRLSLASTWGTIEPAGYGVEDLPHAGVQVAPVEAILIADEFSVADVLAHERRVLEQSWSALRGALDHAGLTVV